MTSGMTSKEVLEAMAESPTLADEVLKYLNYGMGDEWDCTLPQGLEIGFGGDELQIAAKSGLILCKYHEEHEEGG